MARLRVLDTAVRANTRNFERGMKRAGRTLRRFGGLIAVYFGTRALRQRAQELDRVAKTSLRLGIASEKLMGLHHAAELSGVSVRTFNMAMQRMIRRVAEAASGMGEARGALKELGLDAEQLVKERPDEMFRQIADAMEPIKTQADKVRLAMKLFDSEGVSLVQTLSMGRDGLDEMQTELERMGGTMTSAQLREVETLNDNLTRLGRVAQTVGNRILTATSPIINLASELFGLGQATDKSRLAWLEFKRVLILGSKDQPFFYKIFGAEGVSDANQEVKNLTNKINKLREQINRDEEKFRNRQGFDPLSGLGGGGGNDPAKAINNLENTARSAVMTVANGFDIMSIKARGFGAVVEQVASSLASMASQAFAQHLLSGAFGSDFIPSPFSVDDARNR